MLTRADGPRLRAALVATVLLAVAGCAGGQGVPGQPSRAAVTAPATPTLSPSVAGQQAPAGAVPLSDVADTAPAVFKGATVSPDILVYADDTVPADTVKRLRAIPGVSDVSDFSMATFYSEERQVTYAAVDPDTFRAFTPPGSAQSQAVWKRVAGGEMAVRPELGKKLQDKQGYVKMGNDTGSPLAHVGAYAPLVNRATGGAVIDAVVNQKWAGKLKMKRGNALLVSTAATAPRKVTTQLRALLGKGPSIQILAVDLDVNATQTAVLTGGSVSAALGTLRYTANGNGSVNPDPAWVSSYIRTETVPILGRVTCNKLMLPELRAALTEVVSRGLADRVHPGEYGGCYVPRYIAGTQTLSFHTFGTALDINVPGNLRGTVGQLDRQVVAIFKRWGFAWGGDWGYTDPMHFELHQLKRAG